MQTHIQNHATRLFNGARKVNKDPLTLLVPLLTVMVDAHRAAPVVAAIRMVDPFLTIPDTPFYRQVAAIIAADSAHLSCPESPDKLITDYHVVPASDTARRDMADYRKKNGMVFVGNRYIPKKKSDVHNDFTKF